MRSVALIVLNYNDHKTTSDFVRSVLSWGEEGFHCRVVIVDNRSTDNSYDVLREQFGGENAVDVLLSDRNGGYSYGNNVGARYAQEKYKPDYIAISNPDVVVNAETVAHLLETFEYDERIWASSPVMKDVNGNFSLHSQKLPEYKDDLGLCFNDMKPATVMTKDLPVVEGHENCVITEMIPGSFFVIRADVLERIGYLDENTFLYCEERILGRKIKDAGGIEVTRSDLYFVHAHAVTIGKKYSAVQQLKMIYRSRLYYQKEYNKCGKPALWWLGMCMWGSLSVLKAKIWARGLIKRNADGETN